MLQKNSSSQFASYIITFDSPTKLFSYLAKFFNTWAKFFSYIRGNHEWFIAVTTGTNKKRASSSKAINSYVLVSAKNG